jgi:hypothetical protein
MLKVCMSMLRGVRRTLSDATGYGCMGIDGPSFDAY